jgi:hypothetical protein
MTTSFKANNGDRRAGQICDPIGWLGLAAFPTFALMAWLTAADPPHSMICASTPDVLPVGGMSLMYLLMSLFHLSPWLKLAFARSRRLSRPIPQTQGE